MSDPALARTKQQSVAEEVCQLCQVPFYKDSSSSKFFRLVVDGLQQEVEETRVGLVPGPDFAPEKKQETDQVDAALPDR